MATYRDTLNLLNVRSFFPLSGNSPWVNDFSAHQYTGTGTPHGSLVTTTDVTLGSVVDASSHISQNSSTSSYFAHGDSIAFSAKFSNTTSTNAGYFISASSTATFGFYRVFVSGARKIKAVSSLGTVTLITGYIPDKIYHFVVTFTASGLIYYVDGVQVGSMSGNLSGKYVNTLSKQYASSTIGNVSFHDKDLTPAEVLQLYTATKSENITINGTISEALVATDFKVNAHRYDNGDLTATTITNTGAFALDVPDIPHYVVAMAEQGEKHETDHAYVLGDKVFPDDMITYPFYYECTTAGTTSATAPAWQVAANSTTADGSVIWTVVEHLIQPVAHSPILS